MLNKFYKIGIIMVIYTIMLLPLVPPTQVNNYSEDENIVIRNNTVDANNSVGSINPVENIYISSLSKPDNEINNEFITSEDIDEQPEESIEHSEIVEEEIIEEEPIKNSDLYSKEEIYELAKIIMCEAEGESQKCKEYVGQVVMNRVNSKKFPNTIHNVIFQNNGKTYQFSPIKSGGRWWRVEPNQACYDAAYTVLNASKPITNALYFEDCKGESWHSRNLTKVATVDGMRFYID